MSKREYSNAGKYPCPTCNHMNPLNFRDLNVCRECVAGDKYLRFNNPWDDSFIKRVIPKE